jgi:hypothetical protein
MMEDATAVVDSAHHFFNENYALCGVSFIVLALVLAGKRKAALVVAVSAALLYGAYTFLSGVPIPSA